MNPNAQREEEQELIASILAGNVRLYHQLIRPYEHGIYTMARLCMKNETDAEEVAQATFLKALQNLCTFRSGSNFHVCLISIAINEVKNRLPQTPKGSGPFDEHQNEGLSISPVLLRDWWKISADAVECEEIKMLLQQAVGKLPYIYKQVFFLRDVERLNVNDTARVLEISAWLVKVRLRRARMMLQRILAPQLDLTNRTSAHSRELYAIIGGPSFMYSHTKHSKEKE